jgi:hypothetical protein
MIEGELHFETVKFQANQKVVNVRTFLRKIEEKG